MSLNNVKVKIFSCKNKKSHVKNESTMYERDFLKTCNYRTQKYIIF